MIKIKDKEGKVYKPGVECLTEILGRRLDLSLFINILQNVLKKTNFSRLVSYKYHEQTLLGWGRRPLFENHCYKKAVKYSGGVIRELFQIIQRAALIEDSERITEDSMEKSVNLNKDNFASRIQERDDEIKIKFEEYLEILFDIYDGNKTAPKKNLALLDLLRTRAVMKYNEEGFYDTHPLLDSFIEAYKKEMQKNEKKKTGG